MVHRGAERQREKEHIYSETLRAGRSEDRIPVGVGLAPPVQTGPVADPASCIGGIGSLSWG